MWTVVADFGGGETSSYYKMARFLAVGMADTDIMSCQEQDQYPVRWKLTDINMLVHRDYLARNKL